MYKWFAAFLFFNAWAGYTQETTTAIDYNYSSLYSSTATSLTKHAAGVTVQQEVPLGSLTYTAGIAAYNLDYTMNAPYTTNDIDNITSLKLGVTYQHTLSGNWSGVAQFAPELNSNFKNIGSKDIYPGFFVGVNRTVTGDKASQLTMGIGYKGYFGKFMLMPVINYHKTVNKKISYTLGIPAIDLAYKITNEHVLKTVVFADAFYSKISGDNYIYDVRQTTFGTVSGLEMLNVNAGIEYNYFSQAQWTGTVKAGYSFYNTLKLQGQGSSYTNIGLDNNIYLSVGFKYNLNFK